MQDKILTYVARYIALTKEEEDHFLSIVKYRKFLRRQFVLHAGDVCRHETFVIRGCLRTYFVEPSGSFHIAQFAIEDWWISDLDSLIHGVPAYSISTRWKKLRSFRSRCLVCARTLLKFYPDSLCHSTALSVCRTTLRAIFGSGR